MIHRTQDAQALHAAFAGEGCPICIVVLERMQHSMDAWQYEGFSDVQHRHELILSRGFCPLHTWQLAQHHAAFQLALVYREVLTDELNGLELDTSKPTSPDTTSHRESIWTRLWRGWRHRQRRKPAPLYEQCPLCRIRTSVEQRLIGMLLEQLRSEETRTLLRQSTGLCLVHFTQARREAEVGDPMQLHALLECQRVCVQRTLEEVQELIRKHDYRFSDELRGNEMTAWRRAAELCAGNPGVR